MRRPWWLRWCRCDRMWYGGKAYAPHCRRHNRLLTTSGEDLVREAEKALRRSGDVTAVMD